MIEAAAADRTARGEGRVLGATGHLAAVLYNAARIGEQKAAEAAVRRLEARGCKPN